MTETPAHPSAPQDALDPPLAAGAPVARTASPALLALMALVLCMAAVPGCATGPNPSGSRPLPTHWRPEHLFLRADPYPRLVVEVDAVEGAEPPAFALETLRAFLAERCRKPVEVHVDPPIPRARAQGVPSRVLALRAMDGPGVTRVAATATTITAASVTATAYLHVLFFDGSLAGEEPAHPLVPWSYPAAIRVDMAYLRALVAGVPRVEAEDLLPRVLVHEAGHVLGLVRERSHGDGGHCDVAGCGMQPEFEISFTRALFGAADIAPRAPCASCAADLAAGAAGTGDQRLSFHGGMLVRREVLYWAFLLPEAAFISLASPSEVDWKTLVTVAAGQLAEHPEATSCTGYLAPLSTSAERAVARSAVAAALRDADPHIVSAARRLDGAIAAAEERASKPMR